MAKKNKPPRIGDFLKAGIQSSTLRQVPEFRLPEPIRYNSSGATTILGRNASLAVEDALAAQVAAYKERSSELYKLCDELIDHLRYNKAERDEVLNEFWNKQEAIKHVPSDPLQCLAEIKAEAGRAGFIEGYEQCHYDIDNDYISRSEPMADQYAESIRKGVNNNG